jgi:hypothetical protein
MGLGCRNFKIISINEVNLFAVTIIVTDCGRPTDHAFLPELSGCTTNRRLRQPESLGNISVAGRRP